MSKILPLSADQVASLNTRPGRKVAPSIYAAEVKTALDKGGVFAVPVEAGDKVARIKSELHKAARELGVKLKVWDRSTLAESPFIGFTVKTEEASS